MKAKNKQKPEKKVVEHTCENIPVLEVSGSGSGDITYVDPNIFHAESEEEDDGIPSSQMVQVKGEDRMTDYKSLSTEDFEDNSQESDENGDESESEEEVDYEEEVEDGEDDDNVQEGENGDGELLIDVEKSSEYE